MSDTSTLPKPTTKKKLNFISKKQSEKYLTVKQKPLQIYITLNSCKIDLMRSLQEKKQMIITMKL